LLDALYPGVCELCGESVDAGGSLCGPCGEGLPRLAEPFCEVCGEGFDGRIDASIECLNCRGRRFAFEFARPALRRSEGAMRLVREFKYGRRLELGRELGRLAADAFADPRLEQARSGGWPLVPVPLHRRREAWRQFNQAGEIARELGRVLGLPCRDELRRVRATVTQTRLSRRERQRNLRGAFRLARGDRPGPGAVLVDDVFTTGSTVDECARVLRSGGIQKVVVVTAMRG